MANFPASLDNSSSLPNPTGTSKQNSPDHAGLHTAENAAIIAVEGKVGIGATTPTANTLLFGTGAGTSAWQGLTSAQLAAVLSDETGTGAAVFANTPVLITPKIDSIQENTPGNGTTVNGVLLKSSKMNGSYLTDSTVGSLALAAGVPVQIVSANFTALGTGTTVTPSDDTIPQNTEGDQYMTLAITPKSATNRLLIETNSLLAGSIGPADITVALFQDSTANALVGKPMTYDAANRMLHHTLKYDMLAGTTSATTFKFRAGLNSAGTTTFNGQAASRRMGGVSGSNITITEYKV